MYHKYTGIILKKHPLGEADEFLTIYTYEAGKLRVKAVSLRKPRSRLSGHLETLNEIEFETAGRGLLPVLISARIISINNYLRGDLKKLAFALVGVETLYRLTPDRQEHKDVYETLRQFLKNLGTTAQENQSLRSFQLIILKLLGFGPDLQKLSLPEAKIKDLEALMRNQKLKVLPLEIEQIIDSLLEATLEREIKSKKILNYLTKV